MVAELRLADFLLRARGPARFDSYEHPNGVSSPVGDFIVHLAVKMDERPTQAMVDAATTLLKRFHEDRDSIALMIFSEYASVRDDPDGREWMQECGVPTNLTLSELHTHLRPRHLDVQDDCSAAVYLGPDWDREHGLTYELTTDGWEKID